MDFKNVTEMTNKRKGNLKHHNSFWEANHTRCVHGHNLRLVEGGLGTWHEDPIVEVSLPSPTEPTPEKAMN